MDRQAWGGSRCESSESKGLEQGGGEHLRGTRIYRHATGGYEPRREDEA